MELILSVVSKCSLIFLYEKHEKLILGWKRNKIRYVSVNKFSGIRSLLYIKIIYYISPEMRFRSFENIFFINELYDFE